jgi:[protein-PII] uridylyltransferase
VHSFARTTAVLDQMGLNVVDARLITSANGFSLETYVVLEDNGAVIADPAASAKSSAACGAICSNPRIRR